MGNLANWDYYDGLGTGQNSLALAYSSVNTPEMLQGRVVDGGTYAYGDMASPSNLIRSPPRWDSWRRASCWRCGGGNGRTIFEERTCKVLRPGSYSGFMRGVGHQLE